MLKKAIVVALAYSLLTGFSLAFAGEFTAEEMGLTVLKSDTVSTNVVNKLFGATDKLLAKVPSNLKGFMGPVKGYSSNVQKDVRNNISKKAPEINKYLEKYKNLAKKSFTFEQVSVPDKKELKDLANKTNALLKNANQVSKSLNLAEEILKLAKNDVSDAKKDPEVAGSALGLVMLTVNNLVVTSGNKASALEKDVQSVMAEVDKQLKRVQKEIQANPLSAMSLGGDLALLTDSSAKLSGLTGQMSEAAQKIPDIMEQTSQIIQKLAK